MMKVLGAEAVCRLLSIISRSKVRTAKCTEKNIRDCYHFAFNKAITTMLPLAICSFSVDK